MEIMEHNYSAQAFSFFCYHGLLIKTGHFDIYNEWLFGEAESPLEFNAWNNFHQGDIPRFLQWKAANSYRVIAGDIQVLLDATPVAFSRKQKKGKG